MDIVEGFRDPALNKSLGQWLASKIGARTLQEPFSTLGIFEDGKLKAVIAYNNYHPREGTVEIHGAANTSRWLTRRVLFEMYSFAFDSLDCQTVIQRNDPDDTHLMRMLTVYGFDMFRIPRLRGRDKDELIFVLHDDVWRANGFHKENARGKRRTKTA